MITTLKSSNTFLYVFPLPKGVTTTTKELDQFKGGTKPLDFETDRQTLLELSEKFAALPEDFACASHFSFGKMSRQELGILIYKHMNHHLKQFGV